ncbi:MAG: PEP-CTERM sorting domain-containing protein [Nitrospirota bacterium]
MARITTFLILFLAVCFAFPLPSGAYTITFETLTEGDFVTTQYSGLGVTFSNASVLTAGSLLNELEFPPHSGDNVVVDEGGSMTLLFSAPVLSVSGYFTYLVPLTLTAYDSMNNDITTVLSLFSSNMAQSGETGSFPNELLTVSFAGGISRLVIAGDPSGTSFTLDDLTATTPVTAVPEPGTLLLVAAGVAGIAAYGIRRRC